MIQTMLSLTKIAIINLKLGDKKYYVHKIEIKYWNKKQIDQDL